MSDNTDSVLDAANNVVTTANMYHTWEAGDKLTCGEIDAFAQLWLALDDRDGAFAWLESHTFCDEEGDAHTAFLGANDTVNEDAINAYLDTMKGMM